LEPNENTSPHEEVMRRLGECGHNGGYNVASDILSFLSLAHLPVQITPTRWSCHLESLNQFIHEKSERLQKEKEVIVEVKKAARKVIYEEMRAIFNMFNRNLEEDGE